MSKTEPKTSSMSRKSSKRKFEPETNPSPTKKHKTSSASQHVPAPTNKQPKQPKEKPVDPRASKDRPVSVDESVAQRSPALLADYFAQKIAKHHKDSTSLEQSDMGIPTSYLLDTTAFSEPRTSGNLPAYLEHFTTGGRETLSTCSAGTASPHTLVLAASGIRVADLVRELRVYNTEQSKVAKMIAKHMKLKENIEYLAKTRVGVAVGTPARIKDLVEAGALKMSEVKRLVFDLSYLDEKRRGLLDMKDVLEAVLGLIRVEEVRKRLEEDDEPKVLVF